MAADTALQVVHNVAAGRFEAKLDGDVARADYRMVGDTMRIVHTEVPPAHEGKGIAAKLVRAALDYARANNLTVVPACSYVRSYMARHVETHDLLPVGSRL
jgi:predicted GNAT family acetyltransferase